MAGSWLGLGYPRVWTSEEPFKLARLSLDFMNNADADWQIDIKKSVARPPYWATHRLVTLADTIRDRARKVFAHRGQYGKKAAVPDLEPAWRAEKISSGTRYRINRQHPAVAQALAVDPCTPPVVGTCLRILEETVPVQRIWLDTVESGEIQKDPSTEDPTPELVMMAQQMFDHFRNALGFDDETARTRLLATDRRRRRPLQRGILIMTSEQQHALMMAQIVLADEKKKAPLTQAKIAWAADKAIAVMPHWKDIVDRHALISELESRESHSATACRTMPSRRWTRSPTRSFPV